MSKSLTGCIIAIGIAAFSYPLNASAQVSPEYAPTEQVSPVQAPLETAPLSAAISANSNPDYCINSMAGFSEENYDARYQFYRLTEEMARDVTPSFSAAMIQYGDGVIPSGTPILDVIEDIANPVLRQAAPEITISNMAYVIDFANICAPFIEGQIESLRAYDDALNDIEFNAVISEDALFLRQILSDSLLRLGADKDPAYSHAVNAYTQSLVTTRDNVEFTAFVSEVDDLESLFMTDLDGRLKRSNDLINSEMDNEVLSNAVTTANSMDAATKKRAKLEQTRTLYQILGGRL